MEEQERPTGSVLVVDDDPAILSVASMALRVAGIDVATAASGREALQRLEEVLPDVIVSDVNMPDVDGFELVRTLRADPTLRGVPFIFMTTRDALEDVVGGLALGADDYVTKPFAVPELVARVRAKLLRPSVPAEMVAHDRRTGVLSERQLLDEARREADRAARTGREGRLAVLELAEQQAVLDRLGRRAADALARQVAVAIGRGVEPLDQVGRDLRGRFLVVLPETDEEEAQRRLTRVVDEVVGRRFEVAGERLRVSPVAGHAPLDASVEPAEVVARAAVALTHSASHLDLRPAAWRPGMQPVGPKAAAGKPPWWARLVTPLQIAATVVVGIVLPYLVYWFVGERWFDIAHIAYIVVVVALAITAASIWIEGLLALDPEQPPEAPGAPPPPASAIIAAYLPNEAATIMETVESFLRLTYAQPVQVIVAYNTPRPLPVEQELQALAERDPRVLPYKVEGSTSKAQNVNAALAKVTGEFVGVFDADHQPDPGSYDRAWRWLSNGYDVVQGHCVIRNGDASVAARTVAVEFESIYSISHPGRKKLHQFGIFGGSNGYWRTDLLQATRMRGSMLTEDIDSSLRVVEAGHQIASDPLLCSRELAPTTWRQLWNQRMRWAQGWFQVSMQHIRPALRSRHLSPRQKAGMVFLLWWREVYPWLSWQMFPIVAYKAVQAGGLRRLDWFIPLFVLTTMFTLSVGPGQTLFAYLKGDPMVRRHRLWFLGHLLVASFFYTEYKNLIARVAQVKELFGESAWKVTPRTAQGGRRPRPALRSAAVVALGLSGAALALALDVGGAALAATVVPAMLATAEAVAPGALAGLVTGRRRP